MTTPTMGELPCCSECGLVLGRAEADTETHLLFIQHGNLYCHSCMEDYLVYHQLIMNGPVLAWEWDFEQDAPVKREDPYVERQKLKKALNIAIEALDDVRCSAARDGMILWYETFPFGKLHSIAKILETDIWSMLSDAEDENRKEKENKGGDER